METNKQKKVTRSTSDATEAGDLTHVETGEVRFLAQGLTMLLAAVYAACLGLFYAVGPVTLAWVSGVAVVACGAALALNGRGQLAWGWGLMVVAMVGQASWALLTLGWGGGFQYFVLLGMPLLVGGPVRSLGVKAALALGVMVVYLILDLAVRQKGGTAHVDAGLLDALYYFNATSAMLVLMMLAGFAAQLFQESRQVMLRLTQIDALTQVRNRVAFADVAAQVNARAQVGLVKLSVVLCNLDHLKVVNDTHGQHAGDAVLRAVGGVMAKGVRDADTMLRWTGDEFLAILPETDESGAKVVAERLRRGIEALDVTIGRQHLTVGMTVGVASMQPGDRLEDTVARAQAAVAEGKQAGRRCVIYAFSGTA